MKKLKFMSAILAVIVAASACLTCVFADTGSITVTVKYGDTIIADGVLTLYKVADITVNGYIYTSEFENCGLNLSDLESSTLPWLLWSWASSTGATGTSIAVGSDGTVTFSGLETGIYLVVPSTNPVGYSVEPSVVPVPMNGEYDVEIISKIEPTTTPYTPTDPTPKTTTEPDVDIDDEEDPEEPGDIDEEVDIEDEPDEVDLEEEEKLPQTGQLNYPIPIMAGAGAICIGAGLIITKTDKKK
ncbi:MAG: hypothetical protein LUE20_08385 [Oscillospiraceae bacterium]|nr:hypothetical protein [Oscillospiraceae bacterium]